MSYMKRHLENLAEKLAEEYCRRNSVQPSFEIYDQAIGCITSGPEADSSWDEPWLLEWLVKNKVVKTIKCEFCRRIVDSGWGDFVGSEFQCVRCEDHINDPSIRGMGMGWRRRL